MSRFSSRNCSVAVVPTGVDALWTVLIDQSALAELTPLVARIETQGDR